MATRIVARVTCQPPGAPPVVSVGAGLHKQSPAQVLIFPPDVLTGDTDQDSGDPGQGDGGGATSSAHLKDDGKLFV